MQVPFPLLATLLALAAGAHAGKPDDVVPDIKSIAASPVVLKAVKAQNERRQTLDQIKAIDKQWMDGGAADKVKEAMENPAARELAKVQQAKPYLIEFILTDDQGANVAITDRTSDYWQGDEPKFANAYAGGAGAVYISRPKKDDSIGEVVSQISVPVLDGGKAIGTLTVGVRVDKLP